MKIVPLSVRSELLNGKCRLQRLFKYHEKRLHDKIEALAHVKGSELRGKRVRNEIKATGTLSNEGH